MERDDMIFCKKCGAELSDDAKFCSNCGTKIEVPSSVSIKNKKDKPKSPIYKKWWFWVIIVIFCLNILPSDEDSSLETTETQQLSTDTDETQQSFTGTEDIQKTETETKESSSNNVGSENNPYVLNAEKWHEDHCAGVSSQKFINSWVRVTGKVLSISDYGDLKGYYLSGGPGVGLVCWVDGESLSVEYGQVIEYIGKVTVEDSRQVEISGGQLKTVSWPAEKSQSPITISEWSWTRDIMGGVEWDFKFSNNTNKTIKYITMEWDCYNAVGDLVFDEITRKSGYSVKYTGPLEAGETTTLMCTTTLFYNYAYNSSKLTKLIVQFMDGTIIYVNDESYFDIVMSD